ncbi:hypothetical protein HYN56_09810 [Flavobacterium crocinum]|uniref:Molybdenum ABC transporter permease n=1 Tax=Flavobacterium crocinum TaxID=2183896 RepID=A0A2S1YKB5_9FLAO|nr:hypothetical protein HYN56_09810 [Flavobacterium crocinum]
MNYKYLLYSVLFLIGAFLYHKFNKWSLKDRDGNKNPDIYSKPQTNLQNFNSWAIIFCLVLASIIYFFKSIG